MGKGIDRLEGIGTMKNDLISKQAIIHEITESDKISYTVICNKFPIPYVYFNTYKEAERWAKFDQPDHRPYYIIERSEHFEIVGEVR